MPDPQSEAVLTLALMAALADGDKDERERAELRRIAEALSREAPGLNLPAVYQDVMLGRRSAEDAAGRLDTQALRGFAWEMAVGVCDADGARSAAESAFLARLATMLGIEPAAAERYAAGADAIAEAAHAPVAVESPAADAAPAPRATAGSPAAPDAGGSAPRSATVPEAELDRSILNTSILAGALELLPDSLATMAIIPVQMRLAYRVGTAYGYELDRGHVRDLLATLGVGLTSQYVEEWGRRIVRGVLRQIGGRVLGGLGSQATGSAFAFATTYALGQVARRYYANGRRLDAQQLKDAFASMLAEAKGLQSRYSGEIAQRARSLDTTKLVSLVREA
jgi:uncharacterized protein (DUF697 family)/tellurite resistance protein